MTSKMTESRLCGISTSAVGFLAVMLYLIDSSRASLDGYIAGQDYPDFEVIPQGLSFTCDDKIPGYYADPETMCQVWHWCVPSIGGNTMYSFLCNAGTVFNQRTRVCDWFFNVDCPNSPALYGINEDLYKDEAGNYIAGKKVQTKPVRKRQTVRRIRLERKRKHRQTATTVPTTTVNNTTDK